MQRSRIAPETSSARSACAGHRVVEEHQRVQVAVAGVEDVGHPDARARRRGRAIAPQHLGQRGPRDHAVLDDVVGADPADRGERGLAALPEQRPLGVVGGDPDLERAGLRGTAGSTCGELSVHLGRRAVQLDDQHRAGALRVAAVHRGLGRLDGQRVHHLDGGRDHAGGDDRRDRLRRPRRCRRTRPAASAPTPAAGSAVRSPRWRCRACPRSRRTRRAGRSRAGPAPCRRARRPSPSGVDELDAEHVVGGEAVLQAVRAAGVLRDVAADRADLLAGRVRARSSSRAGAAALVTCRLITPGSTTARWSSRSTSRMRRIREVTISTPSACGSAPPDSPVPEPRATNGTPASAQARTVAATLARSSRAARTSAGHDLVVGQPVALVRAQLLPVGDHLLRAELGPQCRRERSEPGGAR